MSETTHEDGPVILDTAVAVQSPQTAGETTVSQDTDEPDASDTGAEEAQTETPAVDALKKQQRWMEQRIAAQAYETREAKREGAAAKAELARYRQGGQPPPAETQPPPGMVPAAEVETRAAALADANRVTDACNAVYGTGTSKYKDFDAAVKNFEMMGGPSPGFLHVIMELGPEAGAKVYYDLGKDPAKASNVLAMTPVKMAVEMAKIAAAPPKIAAVSKAPAPIDPLTSSRARANAEPDAKDTLAYAAWFRKQRSARS